MRPWLDTREEFLIPVCAATEAVSLSRDRSWATDCIERALAVCH